MARARPRKIEKYGERFKATAVKLSSLPGVLIQDVAAALDIHPFMLSRWRKEYREGRLRARVGVSPGLRQVREVKELSSLRREYALLREEHELLKKAIRFCSERRERGLPT